MACPHDVVPGEDYRPVVGFPDYLVGRDGSVWSRIPVGRKTRDGGRPKGSGGWRRLRGWLRKGYVRVRLVGNGGAVTRDVHQLVLEAFVGPRPDGFEACHYDGDKTNNRLENLRWDSHRENVLEAIRQGVFRIGSGKRDAKLREEDIPEILRLHRGGLTIAAIGRTYSVHESQISRILSGHRWKHVARSKNS